MNTPKRPPLLSDEQISDMAFLRPADARELYIADRVCEAYEAARAKDAELIQRLVDGFFAVDSGKKLLSAINEAIAAGYKPSEE